MMLATISMVDVIEAAEDLSMAFRDSDIFIEYIEKKKQLEADEQAQKMIGEFNRIKDQYEEVQRFGKYHPDYKEVSTTIRQTKRQLDLLPIVVEYKKAEKDLEQLLNELSGVIAHSVSQTIKVPTGNPFFDQMSCAGGCGSGGSCSCG
ncbi:regulator [Alkalihalobacillus pseudalcaliphilus]|nr:regulator [Alkalihalobacillus pseudalcaliphilus]